MTSTTKRIAAALAMEALGFEAGEEAVEEAMLEGKLQFYLDGEREVAWYYDGRHASAAIYLDTLERLGNPEAILEG